MILYQGTLKYYYRAHVGKLYEHLLDWTPGTQQLKEFNNAANIIKRVVLTTVC